MFDETKLPFGKGGKKFPCLSAHEEFTYSPTVVDHTVVEDSDAPKTVEIIREPRTMESYSAATLASALAAPGDSMGFNPVGDAVIPARYEGTVACCDSHSANLLFSKWLALCSAFHLVSICTQHRTGTACEEVADELGLLPGAYAWVGQQQDGSFYTMLKTCVNIVLEKYLHIVGPEEAGGDATSFEANDAAVDLLNVVHVRRDDMYTARGVGKPHVGEDKRRKEAEDFIAFFRPPWDTQCTVWMET